MTRIEILINGQWSTFTVYYCRDFVLGTMVQSRLEYCHGTPCRVLVLA